MFLVSDLGVGVTVHLKWISPAQFSSNIVTDHCALSMMDADLQRAQQKRHPTSPHDGLPSTH